MAHVESSQRTAVSRTPAGAAVSYLVAAVLLASGALACTNQKPIVPEKNQKRSQELYGEQAGSMQSLNQTGSEQAAAAHEDAVRPVEPDSEKPR